MLLKIVIGREEENVPHEPWLRLLQKGKALFSRINPKKWRYFAHIPRIGYRNDKNSLVSCNFGNSILFIIHSNIGFYLRVTVILQALRGVL